MAPRPGDFDDNRSAWLEGAPESAPEAPLRGEQVADVAIIGGGFTGLSTAWHLSHRFPDRKIAVIEARTVANGASGRNGGQLLHWINGVGFSDPELVKRVYEVTDRGVRWVVDTIREHDLPVRHRMDGTFELVTNNQRAEEAHEHAEKLAGWGIPVRWLGRQEVQATLGMEGVVGGVLDPHTGVLNGVDFLRGLKRLLLARGVTFYENTPALRVTEGATIEIETQGGTLRAPAMVLGTNGYTPRLGYFKNHLFTLHSHMVGSAPASPEVWAERGWTATGAFCDDLDRIAYGALTPEGRLMFGGGSNASYSYLYGGPTGVLEGRHADGFRAVERRLSGYWPKVPLDALTHRWSGPLGISFNRQCFMGVRGEHKNVYYALGYSGHGVALANLAGQVLCDLYSDHHEPWADMPFYKNPPLWIPPEPFRWVGYHVVAGLTGKSPRRHG